MFNQINKMSTPKTDTPETDRKVIRYDGTKIYVAGDSVVWADTARKLERERDEARLESQWQPIETAPKDEDADVLAAILIYCPKYSKIHMAYFISYEICPWREVDANMTRILEMPTHWMQLPKPPTK